MMQACTRLDWETIKLGAWDIQIRRGMLNLFIRESRIAVDYQGELLRVAALTPAYLVYRSFRLLARVRNLDTNKPYWRRS